MLKAKRTLLAVIFAPVAPLFMACVAGPPLVHPYQEGVGYQSEGYKTQTGSDAGDPKFQGHDYCRNLEITARANAVDHYRWGYIFGIASLAAIGTGTTLTAVENDPSPGRKGMDLGLPLLGGALAYLAIWEFERANAGDDLAGTAANSARSPNDQTANDLCLTAHGAWDRSRSAASEAIVDKLTGGAVTTDGGGAAAGDSGG